MKTSDNASRKPAPPVRPALLRLRTGVRAGFERVASSLGVHDAGEIWASMVRG